MCVLEPVRDVALIIHSNKTTRNKTGCETGWWVESVAWSHSGRHVKITFLAPGNRIGMNLKFLLPFWMNSFCSWVTHTGKPHTQFDFTAAMRARSFSLSLRLFQSSFGPHSGRSPVYVCKPCCRSSRRSPGQQGMRSPSRSTWGWWWWWWDTLSKTRENYNWQ